MIRPKIHLDPMIELVRARVAALPDHTPWIGSNHAKCPICHARSRIEALGLACPLPTRRAP